MNAAVKLLVILFLLFQGVGDERKGKWVKEEFPNPTKDPKACNRREKVSWICDPDQLLSDETATKVEQKLHFVRKNTFSGCSLETNPGYQIAVAVLKGMRSTANESVPETAEKFAKHLHDRWGVGNTGCDDGVMLLLATNDDQVYISTGRGVTKVLTDYQIGDIIGEMKPHLKDKNYDKSVEVAVTKMSEIFSEKVLESSLDHCLMMYFVLIFVTVIINLRRHQNYEIMVDERRNGRPNGAFLSHQSYLCKALAGGGELELGSGSGFGGGGNDGGGGRGGSWH